MGHSFSFLGQTLHLHPFKAIYWEEQQMLLLSDLHLGKAAHFRKAGIAVPSMAGQSNWDRLHSLLLDFEPKEVCFLGDLFHSDYNRVWEEVGDLTEQFHNVHFRLVQGNHDILAKADYQRVGLEVCPSLAIGPFELTHEPVEDSTSGRYNLAGHIHPGVRLRGGGRQRLRLPCFYFGKKGGILPAFGAFTGLATIQPKKGDQVFVIAEDSVVGIQ
jgi:DNA ligase-associated metallophosphoesterase